MIDFLFSAFMLSCAALALVVFIRVLIRLERLERWHHEEHELLDPDIRKKGPR